MHDVLVCPGCRTRTADRIDVRTLARAGDLLVCECGRRYPVIDGVPIVVADARGLFRKDIAALIERDLPPEVAALLAEAGPDDAPWPRLLEHLSIYLDAHWGDRAVPPPDGPGAELATSAIIERIAARSLDRVELAVELGCSVGRVVALNLLDSVPNPQQLLGVVDTLCADGGEVILASPYAWQSGIVDDEARPGGADPAADLAAILRSGTGLAGRYSIEDEADLRWTLRRDSRTAVVYRCHYLRCRKL